MNICTITCHNVYNYGASLQAFALQRHLDLAGNKVTIINFRPWYHHNRYNFWYVPRDSRYYKITNNFFFAKIMYCLYKNTTQYIYVKRKKSFDRFTSKYLNLTNDEYSTSKQLKENPPIADLYIAGSDQIWNTDVHNGKEPAYYLEFAPKIAKKISYAASFAVESIPEDLISFITKNISKFDAISIRERSGVRILESLGFDNIHHVLDPVFLLEKQMWIDYSKKAKIKKYSNYILVYDFVGDERIKAFTREMAKKMDKQIISLCDYITYNWADVNIKTAGPLEFLYLINNADLVISNSFHATAFSIIFQKEFYVFSLSGMRNSSRMTDFLEEIDLKRRYNPIKSDNQLIQYEIILNTLKKYIANSRSFLNTEII